MYRTRGDGYSPFDVWAAHGSFTGRKVTSFDASFHHALRQFAEVIGDKAAIEIDDFCIPSTLGETNFTIVERHVTDRASTFEVKTRDIKTVPACNQHATMIEQFGELAAAGEANGKWGWWREIIMMTQRVTDALMESASKGGIFVEL